ncbi:zinc-binding alcohol dehydrogenase family protein [Pendulispora rubella]|uniref:Zinc-type alcohol dehydrogenase-like protein n=1 Tax=Pendulispora rubella TaxID=2741070 RepID=A0ABZ2L6U0_9BACT
MKAVGYRRSQPHDPPYAFEDLELPPPNPGPRDILVRIRAVSVNPVDAKVRRGRNPAPDQVEVLGWDAVGIVEGLGAQASQFKLGDRVYYAGAINRPGSNSELHAVDERIVALAPKSLNDADAAALPLTSITAYELLFHRLRVAKGQERSETMLIVGGAGGVGSILIQLARQLTRLRIVATASRPETRQWCLDLGAHEVIDHRQPLSEGLKSVGIGAVDYVAALTQTEQHYAQIIECLEPQGALAVIDDMKGLDIMALKSKSIALHWELMFTRSMYQTADMAEQGRLLSEVAALVDAGRIRSTATLVMGAINAENVGRAHALIESGRARGKVVLTGGF